MKNHKSGVYFNLDEVSYHNDPALGSTDIKRLAIEPEDYWYNSAYNPVQQPFKQTPAMALGTAVHVAVLYGLDEFRRRYGRCQHPGNVKAGMIERETMKENSMIPMLSTDYDRAIMAETFIRSRPSVANAFVNCATEVSIFWEKEIDGIIVRRKARVDSLKIRGFVDLKTHARNERHSFVSSCLGAIKERKYAVQAAAYLDAVPQIKASFKDGSIFGAHPDGLLELFCAQDIHAFTFVFWSSTGMAKSWGCYLSPGNPQIIEGKSIVDAAIANFVDYYKEFGTEKAWIRDEPLAEADPDEVNRWYARDAA
jgi:PDDEXK-like domain of unknown function (DUF3799)